LEDGKVVQNNSKQITSKRKWHTWLFWFAFR
jgi:hypothetical protein